MTSLRPPDLLRKPGVTISVPRSLVSSELTHFIRARRLVNRRLLTKCRHHHRRHKIVKARVLMQQHEPNRIHLPRNPRDERLASDGRSARPAFSYGAHFEAGVADYEFRVVGVGVAQLGLRVADAGELVVVVVFPVFDDFDAA